MDGWHIGIILPHGSHLNQEFPKFKYQAGDFPEYLFVPAVKPESGLDELKARR
ncbi:hypothetical protein D3C72_1823670 [compost metagenome]